MALLLVACILFSCALQALRLALLLLMMISS
jgi:hypothetical protein